MNQELLEIGVGLCFIVLMMCIHTYYIIQEKTEYLKRKIERLQSDLEFYKNQSLELRSLILDLGEAIGKRKYFDND